MRKISLAIAVLTIFVIASCKKTEDMPASRLFRPVVAGQLQADSNTIIAAWQKIKGAKSYQFELSRDTFKTIDLHLDLDTNVAIVKNLFFNQLYQVQVKAIAPDTTLNSKWSFLGSVKTLSSVLNVPSASEITDGAVKVSWKDGGAQPTAIKLIRTSDSSVVTQVNLTAGDIANKYRVITGLNPSTKYTIYLLSGTLVRGWVDFTTNPPPSANTIDLRGISGRPSLLVDTLGIVPDGSVIWLNRNETYNIATSANLTLSKSVTIMSGPDLSTSNQARLYFTANFTVANNSNVGYLDFKDVYLYGQSYSTNYVFNTASSGVAATIGRISFEDCKAEIFRGLGRTQSSNGVNVTNFIVNKCIVDSLSGYGVITVDNAAGKIDNISITNSTIYKAEKIIVSAKVGSTSVTMSNCTINEAPLGNSSSSFYIDYGTFNVTNGINITNCIFGIGKNNAGATNVRGVRAGTSTTINTNTNNFRTSDQVMTANDIPNIVTYSKTTIQLWQDPLNGNFKIIDSGFPGKNTSGDPRWR